MSHPVAPPLEAGTTLLHDAVILLGFALVFVLVFRRLGLGATLGYLIAGAICGPQVLNMVAGAQSKLHFAELGIVLLLFLVGLELNPSRLWRMRHDIFGFGLLQVLICGVATAALVWLATGSSLAASAALGLPLALSSTAQVLPLLQSAGRLRTPFGERAFSILLFQDLSIVPMITLIAAMSRNPADVGGPPGWLLGVYTLGAIVGLVLVGRFLLRPLFRLIGNLGEREMFIFAALFPFRSILLGLFFLSVGMMLDLHAIADRPFFVIGMALALIALKAGIIMGLAMLFRMAWRPALGLGLLLSQGGEFGFVLFAQAQSAMLIEPEAASLFGAIVTLSMASTPFLMMATRKFRSEPVNADAQERDAPVADGANALIVGYGRFGQTVAQMLLAQGIQVTLIDTDIEMIDVAGSFGAKVYYGDGTRMDVLRQAGAAEAELILFCLDGDQIEPDLVEGVHEAFPQAAIFVRAFDRRAFLKLRGAPVAGIVRELLESAVKMARLAMQAAGVDVEEIDRSEALYRARDRERLKAQIESNDLRAKVDRVITDVELPAEQVAEDQIKS